MVHDLEEDLYRITYIDIYIYIYRCIEYIENGVIHTVVTENVK